MFPQRRIARLVPQLASAAGAFVYRFSCPWGTDRLCGHCSENTYFWGVASGAPPEPALTEVASGYLANFVFTGDPNPGPHAPAVHWPRYTNGTDTMLELAGAGATARPGLRAAQCEFWDDRTVPIAALRADR